MLARLLLFAVVNKITVMAPAFKYDYSHMCWNNLFDFLEVLQEFLFQMPVRASG